MSGSDGPDSSRDALVTEQAARRVVEQQLQALSYGISHDLRGPLRGIQTHVTLLEKRLGDGVETAARQHLDGIRDAARRMMALLDGLAELSRASRAELRPARVDLSLLADWAAAECGDALDQIDLQVQPGMTAHGDERLLKLMLDKLIGNACSYARGSVVRVSGQCEGGGYHLQVADAGIGFDAAHAQRVFEPFMRAHSSDEGAGHGLGLAVVAEVMRRHGGRAWAESTPGEGATFHVWWPDAPA